MSCAIAIRSTSLRLLWRPPTASRRCTSATMSNSSCVKQKLILGSPSTIPSYHRDDMINNIAQSQGLSGSIGLMVGK